MGAGPETKTSPCSIESMNARDDISNTIQNRRTKICASGTQRRKELRQTLNGSPGEIVVVVVVVVVDLKHVWLWTVWSWKLEMSLPLRCALGLSIQLPLHTGWTGFGSFPSDTHAPQPQIEPRPIY